MVAPHDEFDPAIDRLTDRFASAETAIAAILAGVGAASAAATPAQLREAATRIAGILSALLRETARWIEAEVPQMYRKGAEEAARSMALRMPADVARALVRKDVHRQSLKDLAQNLLDDMARATENMYRDAKRTLREIGRRQLQKAMARTNPMARVRDFGVETEEHEIAFVDRAGKRWRIANYAEMALRTQTAVLLNAGSLNAALELGSPGVRVSDGGPGDVDEPCERANGQVWSLPYAIAHPIEHPNCRRAFAPLPRSWRGKVDRDVAA